MKVLNKKLVQHKFFTFILFAFFIFSCTDTAQKDDNKLSISEKISLEPNNVKLLNERIMSNYSKGKLEACLFDLEHCIKIDSLNAKNYYLASKIFFEISKENHTKNDYPNLALEYINKSIKISQNDAKAFALRGEILLAFGKYKDAIEMFNKSLKLDYNQSNVHLLLGYCFKNLNNIENSIICFYNSIDVDPQNVESYIQLGQVYHKKLDTLAIKYYNSALRLDSKNINTLYNKALFYQHIKDYNKAIEGYNQLFKYDPFNMSGHYNLGFIHMELEVYDVAANNFSDAIYSYSNFHEAYYSRGICFENLGNIAQAEVDYKRALEIKPDYTYAKEAYDQLLTKNNKLNYEYSGKNK